MPLLVPPVVPADSLRAIRQPWVSAGGGLELRPWRLDDAATVREAFECPKIQRWHLRRLDSDAEARDWTAQWAARWTAETDASWALVVRPGDRPVGQVGLRNITLVEGGAELSYWVLPAARGAGVAGRAVTALTRWAFGTLGLNRLVLLHSTRNRASCRVAGKVSYRTEGILRQAMLHADGWHDVHLHARLRSDGDRPPALGSGQH